MPWDRETFLSQLKQVGGLYYHATHPFHLAMHAGDLNEEQIRAWVTNRFYYQAIIPRKDALIVAKCPLRAIRQEWLRRIVNQDGTGPSDGGIEAWLQLGTAVGLDRDALEQQIHVVPAARTVVDRYPQLIQHSPWQVAIASSLTELFAPDLMRERIFAFEQHYPWIDQSGLNYFRRRLTQAKDESAHALAVTLEYCNTEELQQQAVAALTTKCDILWKLLDAIAAAAPLPIAPHSVSIS
jgi:pyrroloquinoline-quinone synthase